MKGEIIYFDKTYNYVLCPVCFKVHKMKKNIAGSFQTVPCTKEGKMLIVTSPKCLKKVKSKKPGYIKDMYLYG